MSEIDSRPRADSGLSMRFGPRDLLLWVVANGLGWGLGGFLAMELEFRLIAAIVQPATSEGGMLLAFAIHFTLIGGLMWIVVGYIQRHFLRPGLTMGWHWVWVGALGALIGAFAGLFGTCKGWEEDFYLFIFSFSETKLGTAFTQSAYYFGGIGLGAGLLQAWLTAKMSRLSRVWWSMASLIGGILGGLIAPLTGTFLNDPSWSGGLLEFILLFGMTPKYILAGILYGIVTGLALMWLVRWTAPALGEPTDQQAWSAA